jgi:hypothetical protein
MRNGPSVDCFALDTRVRSVSQLKVNLQVRTCLPFQGRTKLLKVVHHSRLLDRSTRRYQVAFDRKRSRGNEEAQEAEKMVKRAKKVKVGTFVRRGLLKRVRTLNYRQLSLTAIKVRRIRAMAPIYKLSEKHWQRRVTQSNSILNRRFKWHFNFVHLFFFFSFSPFSLSPFSLDCERLAK